jgi:hypothetical protein
MIVCVEDQARGREQKAHEKALQALQPGDRHRPVARRPKHDPEAKIEFRGDYGIKHLVPKYAPIKKL